MKCNYHTHTTRCQHAVGADEEYVRAAIDAGFDTLGFSDHMPWPYKSGFVSDIRMPLSALPDYTASIRALKEKYAGQIELRVGLESEYFPRYEDHLRRLLDEGTVDYLILGQHYADSDEDSPYVGLECRTDEGVKRYTDSAVRAMETGLFRYIAHPDLFMRHRTEDEFNAVCEKSAILLAETARKNGMPIEYNLLGLFFRLQGQERGYPSAAFWQAVKPCAGDVIVGVDAHDPAQLRNGALWDEGHRQLAALGYAPIDSLSF